MIKESLVSLQCEAPAVRVSRVVNTHVEGLLANWASDWASRAAPSLRACVALLAAFVRLLYVMSKNDVCPRDVRSDVQK